MITLRDNADSAFLMVFNVFYRLKMHFDDNEYFTERWREMMADDEGRGPPSGRINQPTFDIRNRNFMDDVEYLKEVRSFLLKQAVMVDASNDLGVLYSLKYSRGGRDPADHEWQLLDDASRVLYPQLTPELRLKFLATQAPRGIVIFAIAMSLVAVLSYIAALTIGKGKLEYSATCFAFWSAAMGILGGVAFISMNVLSLQNDITFDFSNRRLTWLRIALGGLFGLVLAFPFGFTTFDDFQKMFEKKQSPEFKETSMLLLPFILGFSTTVVIGVLGRLMQAVQALFGTQEVKPIQAPPPPPPLPPPLPPPPTKPAPP